jgi:hypothetical protein
VKKVYIVFTIAISILFLSSCIRAFYFDHVQLKNEINKIEIILFSYYEGKLYPDSEKEYEVLLTLLDEQKDFFLEDFSNLKFERFYGSPNYSPKGICLKIYYFDETYGFINQNTSIRFNKEGTQYVSSQNIYLSETIFLDFIGKYIVY